jgi:hypothetical protein
MVRLKAADSLAIAALAAALLPFAFERGVAVRGQVAALGAGDRHGNSDS